MGRHFNNFTDAKVNFIYNLFGNKGYTRGSDNVEEGYLVSDR